MRPQYLHIFLLGTLSFGCAADLAGAPPERVPLAKADSFGSCEDSCGDLSADGNCWCDDACVQFGDCCADKVATCDSDAPLLCGGLTPFPENSCPAGMYCHYDASDFCGAADHPGTCLPTPEACIEIYTPVCGCDGQTYANSCYAAAAGASVASEGECDAPLPPVLCLSDSSCSPGNVCDTSECLSGCPEGDFACPAVCYGQCVPEVPPPPPVLCWTDLDCAGGETCDTSDCWNGCADESFDCPPVCYGQCAPDVP